MTEERAGLPSTQPMCLLRIRKKEKTKTGRWGRRKGSKNSQWSSYKFQEKIGVSKATF